ncbi:MAG TPA: hypothetical protein VMV52_10550 [Candidatus Nanopelagicaceae bacterium]|nr:hypothetical protein [Candidatus Nanopelagicaceae bacterium]
MTISRVIGLPGVQLAATDARDAMDLLRKQRILRTKGTEVRALALSESALAAAELGNIEVPIAVALLQSSIESAGLVSTAPMQVLAQFHAIALTDQGSDVRGRPRDLGPEERERFFALNDLVKAESSIPALIIGGLFMAEVMDIAPFASANDVVARSSFRSILIGRGFDPDSLGLPEVGMLVLGANSFVPALAAYRTGTPEGVAAWLRHLASAVQLGARRGIEICDELSK